MRVLLVGNPNCGKTTLFNALTGEHQRVGNWPGVTVEQKTGWVTHQNKAIELIDLPGIYALVHQAEGISQDELIAADAILNMEYDCILNVIDACHLERHLYLTSQLLELGKPVILILNMMDAATQRGITIDTKRLADETGCSVFGIQAHKGIGLSAVLDALHDAQHPAKPLDLQLNHDIEQQLHALMPEAVSPERARYLALRAAETQPELDVWLADARYTIIHDIVGAVESRHSDGRDHVTAAIDAVVLNRWLALPIFLGIMYVMFLCAINIGGAFQDFFEIGSDTIFVKGSAFLLQQMQAPTWLIALFSTGIGKGISTTLGFIPVIAAMFFCLAFLEASGYMARAAFVMDRVMRFLGLPGKSFVPMIVGFGCNVPAILAARTLDTERDRLLTVMMSPFMSCSARLAIYAVFVAAFFPHNGQNIVFSLYLLGVAMAVFTGFLLRKSLLQGQSSPLILELPAYHVPSLKRLLKETKFRLKHFVLRAGKVIVPVCVIIGALNALRLDGSISFDEAAHASILSFLGQQLTPLFAPMGITQDNWPATVGLMTGMMAKEVVIGTLNALYSETATALAVSAQNFDLWDGLKTALWSIPMNLADLASAFWNPVWAGVDESLVSNGVYGAMVQRFDGQAGAYAYLLFILLYIPCISTMAAIRQEANRKWMWLSVSWSLITAYAVAVCYYQLATFELHPVQSSYWLISAGTLFLAAPLWVRYAHGRRAYAAPTS